MNIGWCVFKERNIAAEQDPSRRYQGEQGEVVGRVPPGGVEEDVRVVVEPARADPFYGRGSAFAERGNV
jgi:hypothetical protein